MPRYFFDLLNGNGRTADHVGQELPSRQAIRREVMQILPDIARDELSDRDRETSTSSRDSEVFTIEVRDENGLVVLHASLSWKADWSA